MTINKRIEQIKVQYFGSSRGSHKKFIEKMNVASNTASNWMKDGYNVGKTVTDRILDAFPEVSAGWLLTGEGEMLKSDQHKYNDCDNSDDSNQELLKEQIPAKKPIQITQSDNDLLDIIKSQQRTIETLSQTIKDLVNK